MPDAVTDCSMRFLRQSYSYVALLPPKWLYYYKVYNKIWWQDPNKPTLFILCFLLNESLLRVFRSGETAFSLLLVLEFLEKTIFFYISNRRVVVSLEDFNGLRRLNPRETCPKILAIEEGFASLTCCSGILKV